MAISLIDNLKIQNKKQNVERDSFATIADMVSYSPNYLPNIFHAMCEETGKMYVYNINNDEDPDLGKWRVLEGSGGGTADVPIEKIKVNGELQTPVNKVVDITVPSIEGLTKDADLATVAKSGSYDDLSNKPTIPTKVSELENDSNYLSSIPEEYVTETELNAKGYLTEHQDISNLVEKEDGKGLSSNDYTTEEKNKLAGLENYDDTQVNADITALSNRVKSVEDEIPNLATKTYVGEQIANAEHLKREIVTVIPSDTEASDNIIYMLKVESTTGNDKYQEYMKIDGTVQMVGDTSVDLTDYAKIAEIPTTVAELSDSGDYAKITDIQKKLDKTFTGADVADKVLKTDSLGNVVLGTYDDTISDTSTNAVQNKAIKTELDKKFDIAQSVDKAGYVAVIGDDGNMTFTEPTTFGDNSIITTEAEYLALPEEERLNNSYYLYDIGVHYKNGVAYSRKEPIQLTMEEYKALKEAGAIDEQQEYLIETNTEGILLGAEDIGYNNAESGIQATTVQGAIDAVNGNLGKLEKVVTYENAIQLVNTDYIRTDDIGFLPKLSRTGNIVTLSMRLWCKEVDIPTDAVVKVLDIPDGYKPIENIYSTAPTNNINKTLVISYTLIDTNTNSVLIRPYNENLSGMQLYFPIMTWITNDELPN